MLVFIDESGHPRPTDDTKRPVLLAVCIKETDIRQLTSRIHRIKLDIYGKTDVEIKATNLIKKKTLDSKFSRNKAFVDSIMETISGFNMHVFALVMEKPDTEPYTRDGILPKQYFYILKRIELYCQKHTYPMALVVFDEQDRYEDKKISVAFNNFLYQSSLGKTFEKILEVPLFANSENTVGVQLADIMAGIVRHYYESELNKRKPDTDFEEWVDSLFKIIKSKSENLTEKTTGFLEYGFFEMSKTKFPKSPDDVE